MALDKFRKLIEQVGGYVHPDLRLLVGKEAEYGLVSLAGVPDEELSLIVPFSLGEGKDYFGPWSEFMQSLGYVIDNKHRLTHAFNNELFPVLSAANHSDTEGKWVEKVDCHYLYGTTLQYSTDKVHLKEVWGI